MIDHWLLYSLLTARRKHSIYATAYSSVRLSVCPATLRYCVKTRESKGMRSSPSDSPVSLLLIPRMFDGGRPCRGKIWVQRGRLPCENSRTVHISPYNPWTVIDSVKSSINVNRKSTMGFPTIHQPKSCVTPNFLKMGFRYPNLSFFAEFQPKTIKSPATKFHYLKTSNGKVVPQLTIPIERYQHFGRGCPRSRKIWA